MRVLCHHQCAIPMSLVLVFETAGSAFMFMGGFWHVLPVPSYIAVCLFWGGVLAWDGRKQKGEILGRVKLFGVAFTLIGALLVNLCSV